MSSQLFSPVDIGPVRLRNRIAIAPMCQYSAAHGQANNWHLMNLMQFGISDAGLVMLEATAIEPRARITHGCLGLYDDDTEAALRRVIDAARAVAPQGTRWGIQLGHAGRKASAQRPWEGRGALGANENPWDTEAPSAMPFADGWHTPRAMQADDLARVRDRFVEAAQRAVRLGFDVVEIHAAHGYLLHQFLSPLANRRDDAYGGSLENRMRFPLEIAEAVKAALPAHVALGFRITGTDWLPGGITVEEAAAFATELKARDVNYVCVTTGGVAHASIKAVPGYQVALAEHVKKASGIVTRAVGMIVEPEHAEAIIADGQADLVAIGRAFLDDPRWAWHAAERLGAVDAIQYPPQYERAGAPHWRGAALLRPHEAAAVA
ncbi:NADH:flavin oxidoreductase/NADH oxidase [Paraburkholderia tropica]|uniref:NADH:flavin oxidoreductase/NADH oxidase n=1 Tax=Paraburkholderia tropica TaxID=92647 RepID=UPI0007ED4865|nr:NADH:flavin oxidoreductase/NADH oxidase [Paraburkholderia tropica]MBB2980333.1 2,4-dienoyl-CoA reductase-like NADH-dependent reductase (Old Yellow Enzyme family) [Paraburkholderia tropica]OBR50639.1 oxidoreductase [Paraburkholderia tropica]